MEYIPCYSAPALYWSLLPAARLASRIILIEQNINRASTMYLVSWSGTIRLSYQTRLIIHKKTPNIMNIINPHIRNSKSTRNPVIDNIIEILEISRISKYLTHCSRQRVKDLDRNTGRQLHHIMDSPDITSN